MQTDSVLLKLVHIHVYYMQRTCILHYDKIKLIKSGIEIVLNSYG